jgi:hypothetical protein
MISARTCSAAVKVLAREQAIQNMLYTPLKDTRVRFPSPDPFIADGRKGHLSHQFSYCQL